MKYYLFIFMCLMTASMHAAPVQRHIVVNNRVITTINAHPISLIDVMKKMDLMFYREHPEHLHSVQARLQFYKLNWKEVLQNMIDRELVMQDAEEQHMVVSPGDVREEIEEIFGPDVLMNLEEAGLTYEDALKMIREDIIIRRMLTYAVNFKAMKKITPEMVVAAYNHDKETKYQEMWTFRILSIKHTDIQKAQQFAQEAVASLYGDSVAIEELPQHLTEAGVLNDEITFTVSQSFTQKKNEFAPQVYAQLAQLTEGRCSDPVVQKNGVRLYFLEKKEQTIPPLFHEVEESIREALVQEAVAKESERYFTHLRKHYDVSASDILATLPDTFTPFELK